MSIAPMQKVQIFAHESRSGQILEKLQELEILEITEIDEDFFEPVSKDKLCAQDIDNIVGFFQQLFPEPKGFIENFIATKKLLKKEQMAGMLKQKKEIATKARSAQKAKDEWEQLRQKKSSLAAEADKLQLYSRFDISWQKLNKIKNVKLIFGFFPKSSYIKWQKEKKSLSNELAEQILSEDEQNLYMLFCVFPEQEDVLKEKLGAVGFAEVILPETKASYAKQLQKIAKELEQVVQKEGKLLEKLKELYKKEMVFFSAWADHLKNQEDIRLWSKNLMMTKKVARIEGWIVKARYQELAKALEAFAKDVELLEAPHSEDDRPPVVLENKKNSPFEAVTTVYGLPHGGEIDPTPFLSIFFALFFGICLSDFGYGVLLVLLAKTLLGKYKKQLTRYGTQLLSLMTYCGFSTMLIGLLAGSYFGINLEAMTFAPVRNFLLAFKITDPIKDPLPILIFAFILGVVQIYVGLWLRFWQDAKANGLKEGFLRSGIWVYFISGLIGMLAFAKITFLAIIFKTMFYSGMIGLIATQGRHQKNPLMKLGSGLLSLYRLSGFMGDILSYSRLFALGLVTSVLAMVINLLAKMTGEIPLVGGVLMVALLIVGHLFNFVINLLGAFVHSARLQYVEYFSKFFEGGGRFFRPYSWKTKYIKVEK